MKGAFAILLSLLLIGTQTALMAERSAPPSTQSYVGKCCHAGSHCYKSCCMARETPQPISSPIAPTSTVSQTDSQWLSAPLVLSLQPAPEFSAGLILTDSSLRSVTAAPLYERNCSYLL